MRSSLATAVGAAVAVVALAACGSATDTELATSPSSSVVASAAPAPVDASPLTTLAPVPGQLTLTSTPLATTQPSATPTPPASSAPAPTTQAAPGPTTTVAPLTSVKLGSEWRQRDGRVLIEAAASGDTQTMLGDLQGLGLTEGVAVGRLVNGWLPAGALDAARALPSVQFIRSPAAATG